MFYVYGVWHAWRSYDMELVPRTIFTLIPQSFICTWTLYPLGFARSFCERDLTEWMRSCDHLPRIEHCESLSFWRSFRPNLFPIFIIVGGKYRTRGESCIFSLERRVILQKSSDSCFRPRNFLSLPSRKIPRYWESRCPKIPWYWETAGFLKSHPPKIPRRFFRLRDFRSQVVRKSDFRGVIVRKSRDIERPRDFRSQVVQKSHDIEGPRDFRSLVVRKSRDIEVTRDFRSLVFQESRDVGRPRDFRRVTLQKSRDSFQAAGFLEPSRPKIPRYWETAGILQSHPPKIPRLPQHFVCYFHGTVIIFKKRTLPLFTKSTFFILTLCFDLTMTTRLRQNDDDDVVTIRPHDDNDDEATTRTHINNDATTRRLFDHTTRHDTTRHDTIYDSPFSTRRWDEMTNDGTIHDDATICDATAHDTTTRWADNKTWTRWCEDVRMRGCKDALMQRCNDATMQPCNYAIMQRCNNTTIQR
jgi:hypothetical protein